jgi:hypothetical protein
MEQRIDARRRQMPGCERSTGAAQRLNAGYREGLSLGLAAAESAS